MAWRFRREQSALSGSWMRRGGHKASGPWSPPWDLLRCGSTLSVASIMQDNSAGIERPAFDQAQGHPGQVGAKEALAAAEQIWRDHQPEFIDEVQPDQAVGESCAAKGIDVLTALQFQPTDGSGQVFLHQGRV